jgi:hypothetical protein
MLAPLLHPTFTDDKRQAQSARACLLVFHANGDEMRLMTAAALTFAFSTLASAEVAYPVSVPQECVELANREGVPTVIQNRYQAAKARLKLYRLSTRDPLVRECRQAVDRMRAAMQEQTPSKSTYSLSSSPTSSPQTPAMSAPQ